MTRPKVMMKQAGIELIQQFDHVALAVLSKEHGDEDFRAYMEGDPTYLASMLLAAVMEVCDKAPEIKPAVYKAMQNLDEIARGDHDPMKDIEGKPLSDFGKTVIGGVLEFLNEDDKSWALGLLQGGQDEASEPRVGGEPDSEG